MKKTLLPSILLALIVSCSPQDDFSGLQLGNLLTPIEGQSMRSTSTKTDSTGKRIPHNSDNSRVLPGESKVVLEADGPGIVTHMWFTFLGAGKHTWAPEGSATHQEMLIRVYYDGNAQADIEVPFGDFFANCFGKRSEVISLPVIVEDADSYNCFWPMPFRKSCRIEVVNQNKTKNINLLYFNIDWIKKKKISKKTPYFYAYYHQEYPNNPGGDYVFLETKGKGHYVGTVMGVRTRSPSWFGEGDEKIYIDGEQEPSIWGTGTEDYFLSAWGLKAGVNTPYFGTVYFDQWGIVGGHTSAYRWHLADPIVFNKSIKVTIEHYGWISPDENKENRAHSWNERIDDYASVAFWYQTGKPSVKITTLEAESRVLPSLDLYSFPIKVELSQYETYGGKAEIQDNLDFYPNGQLFFNPTREDASVKINFEILKKEPIRLLLALTKASDYGIWQAYLNGIKLGEPVNLFSSLVRDWEHHLLDFWPDPGTYELELRLVGQDQRSTDNILGLESVRLRKRTAKVKEIGFDQTKDWKTEQILYN